MKTLLYFVSKITDSGGVSRVVSLKANYLADVLGYTVHIVSTNDRKEKPFYLFSDKIQLHFFKSNKKSLVSFLNLKAQSKKLVDKIRPDIVLVTDNGLKGLFIKQWLPKSTPCIYELHANPKHFYEEGYDGVKKYIHQFFIDKYLATFNRVVVLRDQFVLPFMDPSKQLVIPNPLSFETDRVGSLNYCKAIAVGRLISLKGYERLLNAWKKIVDVYPHYVLEIYGEPSDEFDITSIIASLQLEKKVRVFLPTTAIKEKYLQADFLLHASFFEAFPMTFLEAMQCGLPVICYDIGANDFLDVKRGFVVANERDFVIAVNRLIENEILRKEEGIHNRMRSNAYRLEKIMSYWDSLFKEIK